MNGQLLLELPPLVRVTATWNPFEWSTASYLIAIAVVLLLAQVIPRSDRWHVRLGRELMIIAPAVFLYFAVRGVVNAREEDAVRNAEHIVRVQDRMGIFYEPTLQGWMVDSNTLVRIVNWVYIWGHWPVVVGTLVWLIVFRPHSYRIYRNAFLISGVVAMIVFVLFPVAPPRLIPELSVIDTVTVRSQSYRVLQPPALTNPFAAMPSLHFGWNLLMGIAIARESRIRVFRIFGFLIPIAMFLAIVLTANHYFLDGLAGGGLVLGSLWLSTHLLERRGVTLGAPEPEPIVSGLERDDQNIRDVALPVHALAGLPVPITIAHRAGNSIEKARAAESAGIDVVEADLWLHRGRLEVRHSKTLGPIPIRWDRWSLETTVDPCLGLGELLQALKPETRLMLDLKGRNPDLPGRLLEEMRRQRASHQILVCSQNWRMLEQFRGESNVGLVHSVGSKRQLFSSWRVLEDEDFDAVSIHLRLLDAETIRLLKERVSLVITWPVNTSAQLRRAESLGVTGVISDDATLLAGIKWDRVPNQPVASETDTGPAEPAGTPALGRNPE